jgi:RND superfamily putative drug exporter
VGSHPIVASVVGILIMAILAIPVLDIRLGAQDNGQFPTSTTLRQSYDAITKAFGVGANGPLSTSVDVEPPARPDTKKLDQLQAQEAEQQQAVELGEAPPPTPEEQAQAQQQEEFLSSPASDPRLTKLRNQIQNQPDVEKDGVSPPTLNNANTAALFSVVPKSSPSADKTENLVNDLRDTVIPKALEGTKMSALVGGTTAANIDLAEKLSTRLLIVILIIVGISFVLLTLAFRTIVVPAIASALNLLAVAASYGILTGIFEKGWGIELIGLDHAIPVVSFVPLLMFAVLFGLSTDYTVFLLTRVSEEFALRGDHHEAIVEGLARAARVIVAAASIMILVFASFILNGDPTVKQFGVGFSVAVAIDAAVVCVVLPSVMLLLGKTTWFLPKVLDRAMPNLGIEGEEYFQEGGAGAKGAKGS